jgi:hypothetical protein
MTCYAWNCDRLLHLVPDHGKQEMWLDAAADFRFIFCVI